MVVKAVLSLGGNTVTHLAVLSTANLTNNLVLFLISPVHCQSFVVPVISRPVHIHIRVDPKNKNTRSQQVRKPGKPNAVQLTTTNIYPGSMEIHSISHTEPDSCSLNFEALDEELCEENHFAAIHKLDDFVASARS
jgi:hypothetical protein